MSKEIRIETGVSSLAGRATDENNIEKIIKDNNLYGKTVDILFYPDTVIPQKIVDYRKLSLIISQARTKNRHSINEEFLSNIGIIREDNAYIYESKVSIEYDRFLRNCNTNQFLLIKSYYNKLIKYTNIVSNFIQGLKISDDDIINVNSMDIFNTLNYEYFYNSLQYMDKIEIDESVEISPENSMSLINRKDRLERYKTLVEKINKMVKEATPIIPPEYNQFNVSKKNALLKSGIKKAKEVYDICNLLQYAAHEMLSNIEIKIPTVSKQSTFNIDLENYDSSFDIDFDKVNFTLFTNHDNPLKNSILKFKDCKISYLGISNSEIQSVNNQFIFENCTIYNLEANNHARRKSYDNNIMLFDRCMIHNIGSEIFNMFCHVLFKNTPGGFESYVEFLKNFNMINDVAFYTPNTYPNLNLSSMSKEDLINFVQSKFVPVKRSCYSSNPNAINLVYTRLFLGDEQYSVDEDILGTIIRLLVK